MTDSPRSHSPSGVLGQSLSGMLALVGLGITGCCWIAWGPEQGQAAGVGSAVSVVNWMALRWLGRRILSGTPSARTGFSLLLVAKMTALMAVILVLLRRFEVEPLGLTLGLGVLFVGPVLGGLLSAHRDLEDVTTAGPAGEE